MKNEIIFDFHLLNFDFLIFYLNYFAVIIAISSNQIWIFKY